MNAFYNKWISKLCLLPALLILTAGPAARAGDIQMNKGEVAWLAGQYVRAVEKKDFAAWRELLAPLHSKAEELSEEFFLEQTQGIKSLSIGTIDGLNVALEIKYISGALGAGTLQLEPAGRIKYTPFCFKHPLYTVCAELEPLLHDRQTLMGASTSPASREETTYILQCLGIPLFNYDPFAATSTERRDAALNILEWLEENGRQYDATGPNVFIPPHEFDRLMQQLRSIGE